MQKTVQQFASACGRAKCYVENDMPIGIFHDFLMELKGTMVERMIAAHKEQIEQAAAHLQQDPELTQQESCEGQQECEIKEA